MTAPAEISRTKVVVMNASLNLGGAERTLAEVARRLDRSRFDVHVICLYEAGPVGEGLRSEGVPVTDRLLAHKADFRGLFQLVRTFRRLRPDVLYYNNQPLTQLWGWSAAFLARVPATVTVFHFASRRPRGARRGLLVNRLLGKRVDACVALSEAHKRYVAEIERIPEDRIVVIPNGIDVAAFSVAPDAARELRRDLGISAERVVVSIVAQLRPEKNHAMLLRAARQVLGRWPQTTFLIVGDGDERGGLERVARDLGVEHHVHFLGARSDVPSVMAASDIGVLCSFGEAFPLSVLEFMAAGRPVVSTDVGSINEIVEPGRTGNLVPSDDSAALAEALGRLIGDRDARAAMGVAARARVQEEFTVERMIERTEDLLGGVLAGRRLAAPARPSVIVVGPRPRLRGGVSTHIRTLLSGGLTDWFDLVHLEVGFYDERASRAQRLADGVRKILRLRALVRRHPHAIVHLNPSMDTRSLARDLPMIVVAARRGSPVVVQFHGGLMDRPWPMRHRIVRRLVLRALERATLVVVLSRLQKESIVGTLEGGASLAIEQVPLFLDLRPFEERLARRTQVGPPRSFAFVGRLVREKGVAELIEAAAVLRRGGRDVVVEIAGAGPDEDEMRRRWQELGLGDAVMWHGFLDADPKLDLLARSDVFVLASSWLEGLPNALLEALAMGLPVIVSDVGAMAEVVEDGVNGFLVPAGDVDALADRMTYIVDHPEEARAMGRRNARMAASRFGLDSQAAVWREVYSRALEEVRQ